MSLVWWVGIVSSSSIDDIIIGQSAPAKELKKLIEVVAEAPTSVLVLGETGTGKELVARAIHAASGRGGRLVSVNCAAIPSELLESEIFGHEKGAFTSAHQRRIGRFEQADGGTLFLDEIGEIDAATQVKLLRALSERTIERVGANKSIEVDVRVVAATNKKLRDLVASGEFREDLFFRLNVVSIRMPPLRERAEDVVLLASAFLHEFAEENDRPVKPLSDDALALLRSYRWPGNVRELRTAIEHGVVMSNEQSIERHHLPDFLDQTEASPLLQQSNEGSSAEKDLAPTDEFNLHALEMHAIRSALRHTSGNRTKAADLLGISRRTLQRKLKDLSTT